jgi:L-rhamnose-H+ transport protein
MNNFLLSIILVFIAGTFQGTFGLGMKKFSPFSWEAFWILFSITGMLIIPILWSSYAASGTFRAIGSASRGMIAGSMLFGALWGVGSILFGLAITYIGMSLTYGITMGLAAVMGAVVPLIRDENISSSPALPFIITGIVIMLAGIVILTFAGIQRDRQMKAENNSLAEIKTGKLFWVGVIFSIANGVAAALLNIGFIFAQPIVQSAIEMGDKPQNASLIAWVVVLWGGFLVNGGYALYLLISKKSFVTFLEKGSGRGYLSAIITALLWFAALGIYGQGAALMGSMGPVIGWTMFLALSLVISTIWGLASGEWKGVSKPRFILFIGNGVLIIAWIILGYANSLIDNVT